MSFDLQGGVNGINVYALNPDCPYGTTNGALPGFLGDTMLNLQVPVATDSFIPLQSWASDDTIICPGETVVLSAGGVSTYGPNIVWSTGETGTSISITPQQTTFVIVSISDHNLCLDNYNMQILVSVPVVVVTANPDTAITPPATVQLNCNTQPGWTYLWAPPTGLSNPTIANPVASPLQTTTYCVTVTDSSGCTASACITVEVTFVPDVDTLLDIDIANTFTPNGDGANDFFTLFGKNVASFSFQIFNRWGQLVYETQQLADLNDLSKGWNGTYRGADQSAGVYVWQLKATGTHGGELKQHGDLLLLR